MQKTAILHIQEYPYCIVTGPDALTLRIRAAKDDIDQAFICFKNLYDHTSEFQKVEMKRILASALFDVYEATIKVPLKHFKYYFELIFGSAKIYYTSDGFLEIVAPENCFYYPNINSDEILALPKWAEGETIYQVLVDRFFDSDPSNNPPQTKPCKAIPDRNTYYGGDFGGIIAKLDYLASYGVGIIYLSPVLKSPSYHKYDVEDYYTIESIYGGKEKLRELTEEAHKRGMKVILDGVYGHCSCEHEFFRDLCEKNEKSPYRNWFEVYGFPVSVEKGNYNTFANVVPIMPKLNTANNEVIAYFAKQGAYWAKYLDIDGYRLDVADEISHTFWRQFRLSLEAVKKDALLLGEIWNQPTQWLKPGELHSATNYKFRQYTLALARNEIGTKKYASLIEEHLMTTSTMQQNYLASLLGSHDTLRLANEIPERKTRFLIMKLMLLMPGMPLIYYGDEISLAGGKDPDNRRAMDWNHMLTKEETEFREAAMFRKKSEILKKGSLNFLTSEEGLLVFTRELAAEELIVIANFTDVSMDYEIEDEYKLVLGKIATIPGKIRLDAKEIAVLQMDKANNTLEKIKRREKG
ncbi:MAG TPA: glycoside hydrolase family 13 protein [Bacillota bacterium]|nr:glycoside hydrolase family 13 protein [Bacillota bacterium]